jgi:hypothetical protein
MSTRWRCAVCEAVNDGGDTCVACGATVTQTVVQAPPAEPPPVPKTTAAPKGRLSDDAATEIPVRELPRRQPQTEPPGDDPYDIYHLFDPVPAADTDATYDSYEPIDTRPRVRVYGCCLPIALGILLAFLATVILLVNLVVAVL